MADIYTLKVNYQGCENKIWREAQISSNVFLADVGYMILASFDIDRQEKVRQKMKEKLPSYEWTEN